MIPVEQACQHCVHPTIGPLATVFGLRLCGDCLAEAERLYGPKLPAIFRGRFADFNARSWHERGGRVAGVVTYA